LGWIVNTDRIMFRRGERGGVTGVGPATPDPKLRESNGNDATHSRVARKERVCTDISFESI